MPAIPRDRGFDATLALLREGYRFLPNRWARFGTDIFETRLLLRRAVCIGGPEAAELFYGGGRFERAGAMPNRVLKLLQDEGSVQLLEGMPHRHRKEMFLAMMEPARRERLAAIFAARWREALAARADRSRIVLFDMVREVLTRTVCEWAGVPLREADVPIVAAELGAMIDNVATFGPGHWRARLLRRRAERRARRIVAAIRGRGAEGGGEGRSPAEIVALHRDLDGRLLDPEVAAVELLNVLRPTVAVGRFVVWSALALHQQPGWTTRLQGGNDADIEAFVQEVRRLAPFFPFVGGRVRKEFHWRGKDFAIGDWVLLDLYGTNRDGRAFADPDAFRPARFLDRPPSPFDLVPQGAGDHLTGHRCPGEWITIDLMKMAVRLLTREMRYEVPPQDISVDLACIPALPRSGFVIEPTRSAAA
ncbi:cytochrome P450 [Propylenella binzhouense]|uniref:Cytochrome P450 n=1 Tax=Propylenella binzhouense TaxID=2555902 RepID=A0A964WV71_9HYPH|nr:cytochrome P450 [Propylenella binzhouense]MYZ49743.1 cytochrome P450 [Propylenella binzhouense]